MTTDTNIRHVNVNSVVAHCGIFKIGLLSTQYANDNKNIKTRSWGAAGGDYSHGIYTMPQLAYLCLESTGWTKKKGVLKIRKSAMVGVHDQ